MGIDSVGPRWAIACKFEPASGATLLHGITWQVGATGVLTPVAQLEPLQLAGRTVRRANLFNASYLLENDYRVGDRVRVELKGGVIPLLSGVEKEYRRDGVMPPLIPAHCPSCLGLLTHEGTGSRLKCLNPVCRQPSRPE